MRAARTASLVLATLVVSAAAPRVARACGSSGPDGVSACSLAEYAEAQRPRWRVGASGVYTSTVLSFGGFKAGETRYAGVAELTYAPTSRLSFDAGLGVAIAGKLETPTGPFDFNPGTVASLGVSYRFLEGRTPLGRGFLVGGALVSFTGTSTHAPGAEISAAYDALDLRGSVAGGFTWLRTLSAYGVVRAFGGPVYWRYEGASQLGTDTHHYQVGGGLAVLIARRVDVFAEGIPLGEQAVAAGVSVAF